MQHIENLFDETIATYIKPETVIFANLKISEIPILRLTQETRMSQEPSSPRCLLIRGHLCTVKSHNIIRRTGVATQQGKIKQTDWDNTPQAWPDKTTPISKNKILPPRAAVIVNFIPIWYEITISPLEFHWFELEFTSLFLSSDDQNRICCCFSLLKYYHGKTRYLLGSIKSLMNEYSSSNNHLHPDTTRSYRLRWSCSLVKQASHKPRRWNLWSGIVSDSNQCDVMNAKPNTRAAVNINKVA